MSDWEDDDMFDMEGEETDMGDEAPLSPKTSLAPVSSPVQSSRLPDRRPEHVQRSHSAPVKGKRTVRVRPMPPGMSAKWPDVVSCLLTMASGKQVMFVKGG